MAILKSSLGNLKTWRDSAAHSLIIKIDCDPSRIIDEFKKIFPILKKMETVARAYRDTNF